MYNWNDLARKKNHVFYYVNFPIIPNDNGNNRKIYTYVLVYTLYFLHLSI